MNMDQVWGVIRNILGALVGYAAGKNWIPSGVVPAELVAAIMTLITVVFSMLGKTQAATVAKAAAIVPVPESSQRAVGNTEMVHPTP